ncbi:hypothetical protein [Variovorax rhizosphaerae]|uniref:Uncharacterized protein n=1 Tax=Variovorax rhizosphaerae TaxID=1836200 RepID=A0ABU8WYB2_9BURK
MVDMRSYRGASSVNLQATGDAQSAFIGRPQAARLAQGLNSRRRCGRLIAAAYMPIGLGVPAGKDANGRDLWEAIATK